MGTAVALEAMKMMRETDYETLVMEKGAYLLEGLQDLKRRYPIVGDVDGLGMALRMEICEAHDSFTPSKAIVDRMVDEGLKGDIEVGRQEIWPGARYRRLPQKRGDAGAKPPHQQVGNGPEPAAARSRPQPREQGVGARISALLAAAGQGPWNLQHGFGLHAARRTFRARRQGEIDLPQQNNRVLQADDAGPVARAAAEKDRREGVAKQTTRHTKSLVDMNNKNDKDEFPDRSQLFEGGRVGVLLIHGLGGTPTELRFIAQGLARAGRTVLCCQLAGHCSTPEELRRSAWREWYASVAQAHDRLREHCDIVLAGGLSMGAILALAPGAAAPR